MFDQQGVVLRALFFLICREPLFGVGGLKDFLDIGMGAILLDRNKWRLERSVTQLSWVYDMGIAHHGMEAVVLVMQTFKSANTL